MDNLLATLLHMKSFDLNVCKMLLNHITFVLLLMSVTYNTLQAYVRSIITPITIRGAVGSGAMCRSVSWLVGGSNVLITRCQSY